MPPGYVVAAACVVVALTFVASAIFVRRSGRRSSVTRPVAVPPVVLACTRSVARLLFMVAIVAAIYGSQDPLMNLAPTLIWIVGWIGFSLLAALVANVWAAFDPWRTTFDILDRLAQRPGRTEGVGRRFAWPAALGVWPATALLLAWCWLEVVAPIATSPFGLGCLALAWSAASLLGMAAFGPVAWQRHGDVFALVFTTLGRIAPLRLGIGDPLPTRWPAGQVAFVMAMLSTVAFDGLHGSAAWEGFERAARHLVPKAFDVNDRVVGTLGLVAVWLAFLLAFHAALAIAMRLARPAFEARATVADLAPRLAIALVPIALAYLVAHNFSSLLQQGPTVLQLLSDPLGRQWDLFGSAHTHLDPGLVTPRTTWLVAVGALVAGHMASIVASHRVIADAGLAPRRAAIAMLPMTVLMLAYTAVSLMLIAEPMLASTP